MYHSLYSNDDPPDLFEFEDAKYVVNIDAFIMQMIYLKKRQIPVLSLRNPISNESRLQAAQYPVSVILTFDDGHKTNYLNAMPILDHFDFKACFFITTDWIGKKNYMNEQMIKSLYDKGMTIGSHGKTHRFLSDLNENEITTELKESKKCLENIIQSKVTSFSAPGGRLNNKVIFLARKQGYSFIFNSKPSVTKTLYSTKGLERFTIKSNIDLNKFKKVTSGEVLYFDLFKFEGLKFIKKLFGNHNYHIFREAVLKSIS